MAGGAIFISYRRDDTAKEAGRIYDMLAARVGPSSVFKDLDNIPLGDNFGEHIKGSLPRCRAALIVIGPHWIKAKDKSGRRLDDPHDWVRIEVELAIAADNLRVVPVLVNGARLPRADELPASLHGLLGRNAAIIRNGLSFRSDVERLVAALAHVIVPEMIAVRAGEFVMGSSAHEKGKLPPHMATNTEHDRLELGARMIAEGEGWRTPFDGEHPQHNVRLNAFELGKHPVTFGEWDAALTAGANLCRPDDMGWGRDRRPVIAVSFSDALAYIDWLNSKTSGGYRLPSEAEWEYACRAGTTTPYSTGTNISTNQARFRSNQTAPVASYPANSFGLHDMHGNVWEWCEDTWHDDYAGAPDDGSAWLTERFNRPWASGGVLRGGCWSDFEVTLRSAKRYRGHRRARTNEHGFRVARSI